MDAPTDAEVLVSDALASVFKSHVEALDAKRRKRKARLQLRGVAESVEGGDAGDGADAAGGVASGASGASGAADDGLQGGTGYELFRSNHPFCTLLHLPCPSLSFLPVPIATGGTRRFWYNLSPATAKMENKPVFNKTSGNIGSPAC